MTIIHIYIYKLTPPRNHLLSTDCLLTVDQSFIYVFHYLLSFYCLSLSLSFSITFVWCLQFGTNNDRMKQIICDCAILFCMHASIISKLLTWLFLCPRRINGTVRTPLRFWFDFPRSWILHGWLCQSRYLWLWIHWMMRVHVFYGPIQGAAVHVHAGLWVWNTGDARWLHWIGKAKVLTSIRRFLVNGTLFMALHWRRCVDHQAHWRWSTVSSIWMIHRWAVTWCCCRSACKRRRPFVRVLRLFVSHSGYSVAAGDRIGRRRRWSCNKNRRWPRDHKI